MSVDTAPKDPQRGTSSGERPSPFSDAWHKLVAMAAQHPPARLAWGSLVLALIAFLSVNVIASTGLKHMRADMTSDGLFTISGGTRKVLQAIDEPIGMRLYFSRGLGEAAPAYQKYFERVRALLEQYRDISRGMIRLELVDPEPFSDAEDRAVAEGLRGERLNLEGDTGFFGLAASNSTDNTSVIPFFHPDRERFLEYDVSKLVWALANPKKRTVGVVTTLPLNGSFNPQGGTTPPWILMEQIGEFFDIKELGTDFTQIAPEIDVLMIAEPDRLSQQALYAIDQFALKGGRILAFVDPVSENGQAANRMGMMLPPSPTTPLEPLLKAWGVAFDKTKAVGDISKARRVQFAGGRQPIVTEYVAWLGLDKTSLDQKDVLAASVERVNLGSAGALAPAAGATTKLTPVLTSSANAMLIEADKLWPRPDPVALLRAYKPGGKPLTLAARVSGETKTAFPDGAPKPEKKEGAADKPDEKKDAAPTEAGLKSGTINVLIVADTDMLADNFWVEVREMFGQRVGNPHAHNSAFVLNALENLTGGEALSQLRGRGIDDRPFDLVDRIRRDSERRFREKEQTLANKLKDLQTQLANIETKGDGKVILSDKDKQAIESFKREMIDVRRELRDVKLALRKDIDRLDQILKLANIAGVPVALGLGALGLMWWRRRKSSGSAA